MNLVDKIAIVTGASRGVGAAIAVALAEAGAHVACAARATKESPVGLPGTIDETVERVLSMERRALAVPTNLAIEGDVERMVRATIDHFGRVDILINNAAISFPGDMEIPMKRHDLMMEVNLRAPFIAMRAVAEDMKRRGEGAIVNISSGAALNVIPNMMSYGMSKIALERLTLDAAKHLAPFGIAVNCFRIDVPIASEGYVANIPGHTYDDWEPTDVPAEGVVWMLRQPPSYTGHLVGMKELGEREGIMKSKTRTPFVPEPGRVWS